MNLQLHTNIMAQLLATHYQDIWHYPELNLVSQVWKTGSQYMDSESYKKEQALMLKAVHTSKGASLIFTDAREFRYTISPALQMWSVQHITSELIRIGITRHAIRPSYDVFAHISMEQFMDEAIKTGYTIKLVNDPLEAKEWLFKAPPPTLS